MANTKEITIKYNTVTEQRIILHYLKHRSIKAGVVKIHKITEQDIINRTVRVTIVNPNVLLTEGIINFKTLYQKYPKLLDDDIIKHKNTLTKVFYDQERINKVKQQLLLLLMYKDYINMAIEAKYIS